MRKTTMLLFAAVFVWFSSGASAAERNALPHLIPVQGAYKQQEGWSAAKFTAVGIGLVAGVFAANAALPASLGIAAPVLGATVGGMLGNWGYTRATSDMSMLRRASTRAAEVPSLFQLAASEE
jgi:hypothetical protein